MLFWLAPSQQIRPPIYSFRQRSQRRKIVFKCEFSLLLFSAIDSSFLADSLPRLDRVHLHSSRHGRIGSFTLDLQECPQPYPIIGTIWRGHLEQLDPDRLLYP